jgi:hypothetical protein
MAGKAAKFASGRKDRITRKNHPGNLGHGTHQKNMETVCRTLAELVAEGIIEDYAIGGATAAGFYGEPIATRDIDVFAFVAQTPNSLLITLEPLYARLAEKGFSTFDEEGVLIHDYPVQFICPSPGLEIEAVKMATVMSWNDLELKIMRPEYLAAIAIKVGRTKDRARLIYLHELPVFDRDGFMKIIEKHQLKDRWESWAKALDLPC